MKITFSKPELPGSGTVAVLVQENRKLGTQAAHADKLTKGGVTRAATQWNTLCRGNLDRMVTDTRMLLIEGLKLAQATFGAARQALVLLAKDWTGYQNLCRLVTDAHIDGYYYKPRIDKEHLAKYSEGLIGLSACLGGEIPDRKSVV